MFGGVLPGKRSGVGYARGDIAAPQRSCSRLVPHIHSCCVSGALVGCLSSLYVVAFAGGTSRLTLRSPSFTSEASALIPEHGQCPHRFSLRQTPPTLLELDVTLSCIRLAGQPV